MLRDPYIVGTAPTDSSDSIGEHDQWKGASNLASFALRGRDMFSSSARSPTPDRSDPKCRVLRSTSVGADKSVLGATLR